MEARTAPSRPGGLVRAKEEFDGPRAAGPYDLAPLLDTINLVFRTHADPSAGGARPPSMGWDYTHVYHPGNLDNVRVVSHHQRVVCSIGIYDTTVRTPRGPVHVGGINAVGTHPDYRRFGLATATLADCHERMRATGRHVGCSAPASTTGTASWGGSAPAGSTRISRPVSSRSRSGSGRSTACSTGEVAPNNR